MKLKVALVALLLLTSPALAQEQPANTLQELFSQIDGCMGPLNLHHDTQISVRFSIRRDGSLIGTPRVTYLRTPKDQADRDEDLKAVADAFNRCLPAKITTELGNAIAGQMFVFSYLPRKPEEKA